ncbi:Uncharacterised protein [Mycobacteroides abscessus subsp. massiliense]|nr:Uncharacterised protein [Mycobacteroides abscessus subsp. massiliense]SKV37301.1 Uncharacterised protein [Mycobacteroides abscessus subsp. massiliense]
MPGRAGTDPSTTASQLACCSTRSRSCGTRGYRSLRPGRGKSGSGPPVRVPPDPGPSTWSPLPDFLPRCHRTSAPARDHPPTCGHCVSPSTPPGTCPAPPSAIGTPGRADSRQTPPRRESRLPNDDIVRHESPSRRIRIRRRAQRQRWAAVRARQDDRRGPVALRRGRTRTRRSPNASAVAWPAERIGHGLRPAPAHPSSSRRAESPH